VKGVISMATQTQAQRSAAAHKAAATRRRRAADRSRAARRAAETRARAQASSLKALGWQTARVADTALGAALTVGESATTALRPRARSPRERVGNARRQLVRGFRRAEQRGAGARKRALRDARRRLRGIR
jgi:hypothetical protein